jgi:hypothetical protein
VEIVWSLTVERRLLDWPAYSDRLLFAVRAATCFNGLPVCMPQHAPKRAMVLEARRADAPRRDAPFSRRSRLLDDS